MTQMNLAPHSAEQSTRSVGEEALDILFRKARTHNTWLEKPVSESLLQEVYDLAKMGPTSANLAPARFVFVTTPEAKERLLPALAPQNVEKSRTAPVVVIIAYDTEFYEHAPRLFPHADVRAYFVGNEALIQETAFRNGSLQGAYFMLAARALGLDCGPMSGFDAEKVNAAFFPDGKTRGEYDNREQPILCFLLGLKFYSHFLFRPFLSSREKARNHRLRGSRRRKMVVTRITIC
jgi:3-hydroxypropanoate dehydrogenase